MPANDTQDEGAPVWTRIEVDRVDTLGRITLARPEQRNPLDKVMAVEIVAALRLHLADPAVRSIVIRAQGSAFCAGADLREVQHLADISAEEAYGWPAAIVEAHDLMLDASKPVIAAVDGAAYAGGMGLAGMCDVIVATRAASFATPEVKIGLFPMIIVAHLSRALPRKRLLEMMFTGEPMGAEEALRLGFVNRLVDDADGLDAAVAHYATAFSRVSPRALSLGRRAFAITSELPAGLALRTAQFLNVPFFLGDDFAEGTDAFLSKRRPDWGPTSGTAPGATTDETESPR